MMSMLSPESKVDLDEAFEFLSLDPLVGGSMNKQQFNVLFEAAVKVPDGGLIATMGSYLVMSTVALSLACIGKSKRIIVWDAVREDKAGAQVSDPVQKSLIANYEDYFYRNLRRYNVEHCAYLAGLSPDKSISELNKYVDLLVISTGNIDTSIKDLGLFERNGRILYLFNLDSEPKLMEISAQQLA